MKYKEIEKKLDKKYNMKISEIELQILRKTLTDEEYYDYLKSFTIYIKAWLINNDNRKKNKSNAESFESNILRLIENSIQLGISQKNASKALLYHSLSIGVEQFDKDELTEVLRITLNKVMAEKYSEFKMLDAPDMLQ